MLDEMLRKFQEAVARQQEAERELVDLGSRAAAIIADAMGPDREVSIPPYSVYYKALNGNLVRVIVYGDDDEVGDVLVAGSANPQTFRLFVKESESLLKGLLDGAEELERLNMESIDTLKAML